MKNISKNALTRVRKYFPQVNTVGDSKESITIQVIEADSRAGRKKAPSECALARACVRTGKADGAIIGIGFSYLINGDKATRYKTSVGVGREITSFDRHQDFAVGKDYLLSKVSGACRLGNRPSSKRTPKGKAGGPHIAEAKKPVVHQGHRTSRIRVSTRESGCPNRSEL